MVKYFSSRGIKPIVFLACWNSFAALRYSLVTSSHAVVTKWLHPIGREYRQSTWNAAQGQSETGDGRPGQPPVMVCRVARQSATPGRLDQTSVRKTISGMTMRMGGMTIFGMLIFGKLIRGIGVI